MADWHYNGNYGQLGPLKQDQMKELIEVGVIESKTFVWREGLADWVYAKDAPELLEYFDNAPTSVAVPPPLPRDPTDVQSKPIPFGSLPASPPLLHPHGPPPLSPVPFGTLEPAPYTIVSDKSRVVAGVLSIIPGFGRFYLGYGAIGVLQLVLFPCGIGWVWSVLDGIGILAGSCPEDGYGRKLVK